MRIAIIILVVLLVIMTAGAILAGPKLKEALSGLNSEPSGTEVDTEIVRNGSLIETITAPGEIEPRVSVEISAEVSAKIIELPFDESDQVRTGDLVAKLDDRDLQASHRMAKARRDGEVARLRSDEVRLEGLKTRLDFAKRELDRMQQLYESGDVARRDYDNALEAVEDLESNEQATTFSLAITESSLAAAEADIERSADGIEKTLLRAPIDGLITVLRVDPGEVVTGSLNNPGTVLMTIADLSRMVHIAEVAESDIARIAIGQDARLHINAYPDQVFRGTVQQIALQRSGAADGTGHFRTEVEIDLRGQRIPSGLVANVDIEIESHEGIVVPYQAVVSREIEELPDAVKDSPWVDRNRHFANVVYVIVDGKAVCTPVQAGPSDETHRLVRNGLDADAVIVTGPFKVLEKIKHDDPVRSRNDAESTEPVATDEPTIKVDVKDREDTATNTPAAVKTAA